MFDGLVDTLIRPPVNVKITPGQLAEFERCWTMYLLGNKRYGQAFCEHFQLNIHTPLYHFKDEAISQRWIKDKYL
jgi:hypothetical protein